MRKEVIIAILLGFIVGLFIAYGIYTADKAVKDNIIAQPAKQISMDSALPQPSYHFELIINEPEPDLVFDVDTATVSGQTEPKIALAIIAEAEEKIVLSDEQGLFSTSVELIGGINQIKIIAVDKSNNPREKTVNVIYSTAKIE